MTSPPKPGLALALAFAPDGVHRISQMSLPSIPVVLLLRRPNPHQPAGELNVKVRLMLESLEDGIAHDMSTRPTDMLRRSGLMALETLGDTLGDALCDGVVVSRGDADADNASGAV